MEGIKDMNRLYFFKGSAEGEKIGKIPSGVVRTEPRIIPDLSQTWKMCPPPPPKKKKGNTLGVMAAASSRAAVAS